MSQQSLVIHAHMLVELETSSDCSIFLLSSVYWWVMISHPMEPVCVQAGLFNRNVSTSLTIIKRHNTEGTTQSISIKTHYNSCTIAKCCIPMPPAWWQDTINVEKGGCSQDCLYSELLKCLDRQKHSLSIFSEIYSGRGAFFLLCI